MTLEAEVNVLPVALALLTQSIVMLCVALSLQLYDLQVVLLSCNLLRSQDSEIAAEGHEGATTILVGEDGALELVTTFTIGESANLHARTKGLREGDE